MSKGLWIAVIVVAAAVIGGALWATGALARFGIGGPAGGTYEIEVEQAASAPEKFKLFEDDALDEKKPVFVMDLADSRPFGGDRKNQWQINASGAVIRLDVEETRDADEPFLMQLHPSYAAAAAALREKGRTVLPSLNAVDGKAKQFDDGLYAELDAALTDAGLKGFAETRALVRALMDKTKPDSQARAWLYGALKVGGFLTPDEQKAEPPGAAKFVQEFERDPVQSKPIGFYTWSDELGKTFRFLRYLQQTFADRKGVPDEVGGAFATDAGLCDQYRRILDFYSRLSNPFDSLSFAPFFDPNQTGKTVKDLWDAAKLPAHPFGPHAAFLPYSGSKETRLFNRLFGAQGLPPDADLMMELFKAIRSGKVDLRPNERSGWYDYQAYALETFLLPDRGAEGAKLLLMRRYKERMLQAFATMITKRRETHARQMALGEKCMAAPPRGEVAPRLRVEPNPTYFLRTARAYAFLQKYLRAAIPAETLKTLKGRKQGGQREKPLDAELDWMRKLFLGLHMISCEDIGMKPGATDAETPGAEEEACIKIAADWLASWEKDGDLAIDTRVSVPVFADYANRKVRLWGTLGVRGAKLSAAYAKGPKWRPRQGDTDEEREWKDVPGHQLSDAKYCILVDEFAEIELKGLSVLTREELRKACDEGKTKEAIVKALTK